MKRQTIIKGHELAPQYIYINNVLTLDSANNSFKSDSCFAEI